MRLFIFFILFHTLAMFSFAQSNLQENEYFDNEINLKYVYSINNLSIFIDNKIIRSNSISDLDKTDISGNTSILIDKYKGSKIELRIANEIVTFISNKNYSKIISSIEGMSTGKIYHNFDSQIKNIDYNFIINNEEFDYFSDLDNYVFYKNRLIKCDDYVNQNIVLQSKCTVLDDGNKLYYLLNSFGLLCGSIYEKKDGSTVIKIYEDFRIFNKIKLPYKTITIADKNLISLKEIDKISSNGNINIKLFE